jgi:hypothetical protein
MKTAGITLHLPDYTVAVRSPVMRHKSRIIKTKSLRVKLGYNVTKGTEYFCVVITERRYNRGV